MRVFNLQQQECAAGVRLSAMVESASLESPLELWYEIPRAIAVDSESTNGNPFLAAMLLPAMAVGEPLHVDGNVSRQLLENVRTIQDIHRHWDHSLDVVSVTVAQTTAGSVETGDSLGVFFSLGVDSFYTLLRSRSLDSRTAAATHLVLIEGFDKRVPDKSAYYRMLVEHARSVADELSLELAVIRTNVRPVLERFVPWGTVGHGGAIASCGLAAGGAFRELMLAASFTYSTLEPWGSHPLLDHLWSTEGTTFRHHGCEASRIEKLRVCAESPIAMRHLRVCYHNEAGQYNCGTCEKCIRTMMGLRAIGALDRCTTLPDEFDVGQFVVLHLWELEAARHMLEAIRNGESGRSTAEVRRLQTAISKAIDVYESRASGQKQEQQRLRALDAEVRRLASSAGFVVLIDEDRHRSMLPSRLPVCPFPEADGVYQGPPPDDEAAIRELERLRAAGAHHLIIMGSSFWWLDHYARFADDLRARFSVAHHDADLITFRLAEDAESTARDTAERHNKTSRRALTGEVVR